MYTLLAVFYLSVIALFIVQCVDNLDMETPRLNDTTSTTTSFISDTTTESSHWISSVSDAKSFIDFDNKTQVFLSSFENRFQRFVIETQLSACPFQRMCGHSLNVIGSFSNNSCCIEQRCHCDAASCIESDNCCLDITVTNPFKKTSNYQDIGCIATSYPYKYANAKGITAVRSCPFYEDPELSSNCTRLYSVQIENLSDIVPCYSFRSKRVYRNIYCAKCHGEDTAHLQLFDVIVQVSPVFGALSFNRNDLLNLVFKERSVGIVFNISNYMGVQVCDIVIDRCNFTGGWPEERYNVDIINGCNIYSSPMYIRSVIFKNVFCAMCNNFTPTELVCMISQVRSLSYGFFRLLQMNWNSPGQHSNHKSKICSHNQHLDTVTRQCLDIRCPNLYSLHEGKCMEIFIDISDVAYCVHLQVTPYKDSPLQNQPIIVQQLTDYVMQLFPEHEKICSYDVVTLFNCKTDWNDTNVPTTEQNSAVHSLAYLNIKLLLFYDRSSATNPYMLTRYLQQLFNKNATVPMPKHGTILFDKSNVSVHVVSRYEPIFNMSKETRNVSDDFLYYGKSVCLHQSETFDVLSNKGFQTRYRKGNIKQLHIIHVDEMRSCEMIKLSSSDLYLTVNENRTLSLRYNFNNLYQRSHLVNMCTEFVIGADSFYTKDEETLVCLDKYIMFEEFINNCRDYFEARSGNGWQLSTKDLVSTVSASVSVLALAATVITYIYLPFLRKGLPGRITLTLTCVMLSANAFHIVSNLWPYDTEHLGCKIIGMLVHFVWVLSISWMNVCTYHMLYIFTRNSLTPTAVESGQKRYMFYHLYALTVSMIPVLVNTTYSVMTSQGLGYGYGIRSCYILSMTMIMYTFFLPVSLMILSNLIMFAVVMVNIWKTSSIERHAQNSRNYLVIFIKLSTITGVTWTVGFLNTLLRTPILAYAAAILNTSQGIFIFISFVVNKNVFKQIKKNSSVQQT